MKTNKTKLNIIWKRNEYTLEEHGGAAGWRAMVNGECLGHVFHDGDYALGDCGYIRSAGSQAIAAARVVRYIVAYFFGSVEEGGR